MAQQRFSREEWEPIPVGYGEGELTPEALKELEAAWTANNDHKLTSFFSYGSGSVAPMNWMGTLSADNVSLEVAPRSSSKLNDQERSDLDSVVGYLLEIGLGATTVETYHAPAGPGARFDRAVEAFCGLLGDARRKQVPRGYRAVDGRRLAPRGTLVFPRQALTQILRPTEFECRWVELTQDVPLNRFCKAVLVHVRPRAVGAVQRKVESLLAVLDDVADTADPLALFPGLRTARLPREYEQAVETGLGLLTGDMSGLLYGSVATRSEVIPLPALFEAFVLRAAQAAAGLSGMACVANPKGWYLAQRQAEGPMGDWPEIAELQLDALVLDPAGVGRLVIDAKWKALDPNAVGMGIQSPDLYQVISYGQRLGCRRAALVYPWIGAEAPFGQTAPTIYVHGLVYPFAVHVIAVPLALPHPPSVLTALEAALLRLLS